MGNTVNTQNASISDADRAARRAKYKKKSEIVTIWRQFRKNKLAVAGLIIFLIMLLLAITAPLHINYEVDVIEQHIGDRLQGPSAEHIFGTDAYGRDIFNRILWGARVSMFTGLAVIVFALIGGIALGATAGYLGGKVDNLIMRLLDIIQSLPAMLLSIVLSAVLGPGYFNTILALSVNGMPASARMLRAQMMKVRGNEYIEAAQSINCSKFRIIVRHMIPNSFSPNIVQATMSIAHMIVMAASLSFIGLGVQPPTPEWGAMLTGARQFIRQCPHMVIFPGLAIAVTVLAVNLMGDGLRDALDPKLKH